MPSLDDTDVLAIRKHIHDINNALNVISMQSELIKMLAADSAAFDKVAASIDVVLNESAKAARLAAAISGTVKSAE